jgi:tetratricopeptide (TPR) repeat protein
MRATLACVAAVLIAGGSPGAAGPEADYAAVVQAYRSGDANAAVHRLAELDFQSVETGFGAFFIDPPPGLVAAAAAVHTEAALRLPLDLAKPEANRHLALAASIIAVGEPPKLKRLGSVPLKPSGVRPVAPEFRHLWYLAVITAMVTEGRMASADAYLEHARILFPYDAEILLLSGIAAEMRASARLQAASAGDRRKALEHSEVYLRASVELAPDRQETKLRLGHVLQLRGQAAEARELLTVLARLADGGMPDARLSYLASLFLGGLEDAAGDPAAAARWYTRATGHIPLAQASRLAASELLHRAGERQQAAEAIPPAVGEKNSADPWWSYLFGEYWRVEPLVGALRKMGRS